MTNKQYRRFVTAGGYAAENEQKWWKPGRKDKRQGGWTEPRWWDDSRFNHDSQPVVGVSWYEANAYAAWLTEHLRGQGLISGGQAVRLPTQAEWEQAARSTDGRAYPWGPAPDAARANTRESSLQQTTPVWMYPDGQTPEGVWDMAGNVWEWTSDVGRGGWAWLKGGAWYDDARAWGAAARLTTPRGELVRLLRFAGGSRPRLVSGASSDFWLLNSEFCHSDFLSSTVTVLGLPATTTA
ncbi:MAG: SUMF1/EgtB/PvdO family nonheme iron enzyme [Anaerolineae bacterium]|uniref:formylglycine-generating enzyme family protein n=1 Tax=Candidatus Amarolinea dominans TaxID=3140696 RepID=UPI003136E9EC|nr:SUMF1/EgtB/PvdO family nonheme iron enzyme [Anaerolineae bacterium]